MKPRELWVQLVWGAPKWSVMAEAHECPRDQDRDSRKVSKTGFFLSTLPWRNEFGTLQAPSRPPWHPGIAILCICLFVHLYMCRAPLLRLGVGDPGDRGISNSPSPIPLGLCMTSKRMGLVHWGETIQLCFYRKTKAERSRRAINDVQKVLR